MIGLGLQINKIRGGNKRPPLYDELSFYSKARIGSTIINKKDATGNTDATLLIDPSVDIIDIGDSPHEYVIVDAISTGDDIGWKTVVFPTITGNVTYRVVESFDDLQKINTESGALNEKYIMYKDIDLSSTQIGGANAGVGDVGFTPIGVDSANGFRGIFNGNGFTISNMYINRPTTNYVGLFGYNYSGKIANLSIINSTISGATYVGGLVGGTSRSSRINNCSSINNNITGSDKVGGLVGFNYNDIKRAILPAYKRR
jgi:hypothetical protein